ncbi:hypothetical protein [Pseudonocardia lacus]|uniref:hypothetical protein n=1 Tax=Pseudonocardia lacus TaxID=2835865 RepID=UPI001BDBCCFB|nr:hypothetical protein [Pseudonocardia lacus]
MEAQIWVSVVSLVGVLLGGAISYVVQASTQSRTDRRDRATRDDQRSEARRAEQVDLLRQFIRVAQQAERAAEERDGSPEWKSAARTVVDELWVSERMIHVFFPARMHELARAYVKALDGVLWDEPAEGTMWDVLRAPKVAFLDVARAELAR